MNYYLTALCTCIQMGKVSTRQDTENTLRFRWRDGGRFPPGRKFVKSVKSKFCELHALFHSLTHTHTRTHTYMRSLNKGHRVTIQTSLMNTQNSQFLTTWRGGKMEVTFWRFNCFKLFIWKVQVLKVCIASPALSVDNNGPGHTCVALGHESLQCWFGSGGLD